MLYSSLFMSAVIMIVAAGVGFLLGYIGQRVATQRTRRETEERTRHILHEAEKEAESKKREASLEVQASWYQAKAGIVAWQCAQLVFGLQRRETARQSADHRRQTPGSVTQTEQRRVQARATADHSDVATVFGPEMPADEVAAAGGTVSYEVLCAVSARVPRRFLGP